MGLKIEKKKDSQMYYFTLANINIAELVISLESIKTQKCSSYLVIKELNSQRLDPFILKNYAQAIAKLMEHVGRLQNKIDNTPYLEIAEEEVNEVIGDF